MFSFAALHKLLPGVLKLLKNCLVSGVRSETLGTKECSGSVEVEPFLSLEESLLRGCYPLILLVEKEFPRMG